MKTLKDSSTYQAILAEGRAEGAKYVLLSIGRQRFGPPPRSLQRKLNAIADLEKLFEIAKRLLAVLSWDELIID